MKSKTLLFSILLIFFISSANAQSKPKKELVITVDSADAEKFLLIFQAGLQNLMNTSIPANQVQAMNVYGSALFQKQVTVFQSWQPRPEPPKKDTTIKKP